MFKATLLSLFLLVGCSSVLIPHTGNQFQVVTYSQVISLAVEANDALREGVITAETHKDIHDKLALVMKHADSEGGTDKAAEIINKIREKLE